MPMTRLLLILICVILAAGATVWLGVWAAQAIGLARAGLYLIPAALLLGVVIRYGVNQGHASK